MWPFGPQPAVQTGYVAKRSEPLFADRPGQMLSATSPDPVAQRSIGGNYGHTMSGGCGKFRQFDRDQLGTAQVQRNEYLDNVHCQKPGGSIRAQSTRRYIALQ